MLEAISKSQDDMADEVFGNIIEKLRKRGKFGGSSEERMQSVLEGMWNKVEYALKGSQKMAVQLEECSDSRVMQSVLNGMTLNFHFGEGRFRMLPQSYTFSHGLCSNNFPQVLLIGNQRDQVTLLTYINWDDEVSRLVRGRKVLGDMKYLMRPV